MVGAASKSNDGIGKPEAFRDFVSPLAAQSLA